MVSQKFHKVFVYGTLKTGEPNFGVMADHRGYFNLLGKGKTLVKFPLVITSKYNIPLLMNDPGKGENIRGEVYEVDDKKLELLDELEAYPQLYDRKEIPIQLENDKGQVTAWVYVIKKWREDILNVSTAYLSEYSSKGDHGRPYVDSYKRAKELLDDPNYNLFAEIQGCDNNNEDSLQQTHQKAINDLNRTFQ